MKPPFGYYGGKGTLAPKIVALLPEHSHYVEPFCGSLAVLLAKPPSKAETVNDLDGHVMTFWRVLRDQPDELLRACALTPHSRAEYRNAYDLDDCDDVERARRIWVILTQGRAGTLRTTGWRHYQAPGTRGMGSMPRQLDTYVTRMDSAVQRLAGVTLESRDGLEVARDYGRHAGVLLYVDPPYLGTTRASRQYGVEMSRDAEHRALAEVLRDCEASVVLSGYPAPLYDDLYDGWHLTEIDAHTGQANGDGGHRTECLWSNVPLANPATLCEVSA